MCKCNKIDSDWEYDYKCSDCDTFSISFSNYWCRRGTGYDEIMWNSYYCENCNGSVSVASDEDDTEIGDTIYM